MSADPARTQTRPRPGHRHITVLYVIDSLGTGGSERSLAELLGPMAREGIRPVIAALSRRPHGVERQVLEAGFDVRFISATTRLGRIRAVRALLASERPDIVHTTLFNSDLAGRVAAMGRRIPVVTSLVNTSYDPVRLRDPNVRATRLRLVRMVDGWTARHLTAHFHAVSKGVKDAAVRDLSIPAERITVIERGRDPRRLAVPDPVQRERARKRLGLSLDDEVVVSVGRQEFQKGQRYLIEAMAELSRLRPNAVLLIVGRRGHASEELERLCREKELGDAVRFLGFIEDVSEVLSAADVFVLPSLYEGLPGALIEAMATGLPIVAADIDATREVLEPGRNAILVPSASASHLAGAILRLLGEEETRRGFGLRSRSIFEDRFTLDGSVRDMVAMYDRVVAGTGRKVP